MGQDLEVLIEAGLSDFLGCDTQSHELNYYNQTGSESELIYPIAAISQCMQFS